MGTVGKGEQQANDIRVMTDEQGEPLFVASDIAKILGYRDAHNMTRRLDPDDKGTRPASTPGGTQELTTINESGLYTAILGKAIETAEGILTLTERIDKAGKIRPQLLVTPAGQAYFAGILAV